MSLRIFRRPQAERDIEDAFVFVAGKSEDAGIDFLCAVQEINVDLLYKAF